MNDQTDKLAAEAADTIFPIRGSERWHHAYNAIKSAIEKAWREGWNNGQDVTLARWKASLTGSGWTKKQALADLRKAERNHYESLWV